MNFIFSCSPRHLTSERSDPWDSELNIKDKINIHVRSCNILYIFTNDYICCLIFNQSSWWNERKNYSKFAGNALSPIRTFEPFAHTFSFFHCNPVDGSCFSCHSFPGFSFKSGWRFSFPSIYFICCLCLLIFFFWDLHLHFFLGINFKH